MIENLKKCLCFFGVGAGWNAQEVRLAQRQQTLLSTKSVMWMVAMVVYNHYLT